MRKPSAEIRGPARYLQALLPLVALLSVVGCETADGDVMDELPVDLAGEWSVTLTEDEDPCGLVGTIGPSPWLLEEGTGSVTITTVMLSTCRSHVYLRDANRLTRASGGLLIDPGGGPGCTANIETTETLDFTASRVTGSVVRRLTQASGPCSRPYPCTVRLEVSGERCSGCWPGCN